MKEQRTDRRRPLAVLNCSPLRFSDMGNNQSNPPLTADLVDSSSRANENIFKVDNINSHGRKHSSAKIQITNDDLCIRQKHRQSLHIPLDAIKRYGLDGSIFILECGRRAPLGQARYAFRCKQARSLVECLDEHINTISEQLFAQEQAEMSSSTLTNVSSMFNAHRRRRTQSDHGRSPSPLSLSSATSFYRNSEPDLSENYFAFDAQAHQQEGQGIRSPMNYVEFKMENQVSPDCHTNESPTPAASTLQELSSPSNKAYIYIDHDKTSALKDIAQERLQHHARRVEA